jgi:Xaa-Pro aminopeptidase
MTEHSRHLIFSEPEFQRRWEALGRTLAEAGVDVAILTDPDTIFYLSGFSGTSTTYQSLVVTRRHDPVHLLRYAEESSVEDSSFLGEGRYYNDWDDPYEIAGKIARDVAGEPTRIGVELMSTGLSAHRFGRLRAQFPDADYVDLSMAIAGIRLVKSAEEITMFRRSVAAIEAGMRAGIDATREGSSERDIAEAVAVALLRAEADTPSVGIIASGPRLSQIHGGLSSRKLVPGDLIRLEQSNSVNRYWSRMMRTLSIGEPDPSIQDLHDRMRRAQDEQIAAMRPGAIPADLDAIARDQLPIDIWAMQLSGYGLAFHERSVIGSEIDRFRITRNEQRPIQAGMVFHMYLTYGEGVAISETVAVTDDGADVLTTLPRELIIR